MTALFNIRRFYPMWLATLALTLFAGVSSAGGFSITDMRGKTHALDAYKGKWVLVNYWATWCPPCLEEIPDLNALHDNKKNNLIVIGIAMDYRNAKQVSDFAESMMMSYPIVLGTEKVIAQIAPVQGLPTTYLYNPEGKMVAHQVGAVTRESVETYIASKSVRASSTKSGKPCVNC